MLVQHYIFSILVVAVVLLLLGSLIFTQEAKKKKTKVIQLKPESHSAPLMYDEGSLLVKVTVCNQKVYCLFDTGSSEVVVNTDQCVPVGGAQTQSYAAGPVVVHPATKALGITVGNNYQFNVKDVLFTDTKESSVLGMSVASPVKAFSWAIQYDGEKGGYFTLNAKMPPKILSTLSLVSLNDWYNIKVLIKTEDGQTKTMVGILDTGSTDCFVDNQILKENIGFSVYTPNGNVLLAQIDSSNVLATEGGAQYENMLRTNNALILGLPFFVGKNLIFNTSTKTVSIEDLFIEHE